MQNYQNHYSKYTREMLEDAVKNSKSFMGVVRYFNLNPHGGTSNYMSKRIKLFKIDTSHFSRCIWNKGKPSCRRKGHTEILINDNERPYKQPGPILMRALLEIGRGNNCEVCGLCTTWNKKPLKLQIHHVDGNYKNNLPNNLLAICPNCHSQTDNYGYSKRKMGKKCKKCGGHVNRRNVTGFCLNCFDNERRYGGLKRSNSSFLLNNN